MQRKTKITLTLAALGMIPVLLIGAFLHYYLPSSRKVNIVATEVKRMDADGVEGGPTRDVRFIITRDAVTGETLMFRNEDTRWGWPPYFKFNSGDLAGDAANIKENHANAVVLVTYYGWRVQLADMYPNAVSLEIVDPRYTHIPFFNIFFFVTIFGLTGFTWFKIRQLRRPWRERKERKLAAKAAAHPETSSAAGEV